MLIIDDLFTDFLLDGVDEEVKRKGWDYGWKGNGRFPEQHWNIKWAHGGKIQRKEISHQLVSNIHTMWELLKDDPCKETPHLLRCYCNAYTVGNHARPHTDSRVPTDKTVLVYLNHEWDMSWGGATSFFEDGELVNAVMPKRGRAVIFDANKVHQSLPITSWCHELRQIIVFKCTTKQDGVNRNECFERYGIN